MNNCDVFLNLWVLFRTSFLWNQYQGVYIAEYLMKNTFQIGIRTKDSVLIWVAPEADSDIRLRIQVVYVGGELRKVEKGRKWDRESNEATKECVTKLVSTVYSWSSGMWNSSGELQETVEHDPKLSQRSQEEVFLSNPYSSLAERYCWGHYLSIPLAFAWAHCTLSHGERETFRRREPWVFVVAIFCLWR